MNRLRPSIILLTIFITGCSVVTRNAASGYFKDTIDRNMKRVAIERDFSLILSMDVIHINEEVRKAYTDEYARLYLLSPQEKENMLAEQQEQEQRWEAFYLIVYTAPNLDTSLADTDSIWKLYLKTDDHLEPPASINEITMQRELIKGFFPWISSWDRVYLVRFKKQPVNNNTITFIVTGILGKGEATFKGG
ncbi:MAG: hypothetical protein ACP5JP_02210 [bacterium]